MEFGSEDAARDFYSTYARSVGISRRIVCSKEGFHENSKNGQELELVTKFGETRNHGPVPPRKLGSRPINQEFDPMEKPHSIEVDYVDEPFEGMEFESEEAAKLFYVSYAWLNGFCARISRYCRSRRNNSTISRQIVCSKEGFREVRTKKVMAVEGKTKRPRITRVGCKAMIVVKKMHSGKLMKEHNHSLSYSRAAPSTSNVASGELADFTAKCVGPNNEVKIKIEGHNAGTQCSTTDSLTVLYKTLFMPGGHKICKRRVSHRRNLPCSSFCLGRRLQKRLLKSKGVKTECSAMCRSGLKEHPPGPGLFRTRQGRHATEGSIMHVDNIKEASSQKPQNTNDNQAIHGKDEGIHGSSEETMVDIPAIPLAMCMPVIQNLPGSSAVCFEINRKIKDGQGVRLWDIQIVGRTHPAVPISYPAEPIRQPQRGVCALGPYAVLSELNNLGKGLNSLVHATALACGAHPIIAKLPSSNLTSPVPPAIPTSTSSEEEKDHSEPLMADVDQVGACGKDLVGEAAVIPDLVADEHLEVLLEEPGELHERLLVCGLVRPLHTEHASS
ncbi:hypothetical protein U9M48_006847 [Paspalum notatum var. saurae]|uniref:FAR1 domain-containing protein n=1 Tax=Paspalum notatum var. saurae TaxID=547442 RepID=A0AAQ3SJU4_PASNO